MTRIGIVTPAAQRRWQGNQVTAARWSRLLAELGHRAAVVARHDGLDPDVLVALHARKSGQAIEQFRRRHPDRPLIVALTGTDLYADLSRSRLARQSLERADRLVVLQELAARAVPDAWRDKVRVIYQSALSPAAPPRRLQRVFEVCVSAHLRPVKDPLRAARAARRLPAQSRLRVVHLGSALTAALERQARREAERNPRYQWLGELPHAAAQRRLARSRLLVVSSRLEGGANVISEAVVAGVPVVASRIDGCVGLLGPDYPGYFDYGDTRQLAERLWQAESDGAFYARLLEACRRRAELFTPARERAAWQRLLAELL